MMMFHHPFRKKVFIPKGEVLRPDRVFRPGDVWLSMNDMVRAEACFDPRSDPTTDLPAATLILSHVITSLVLSSRASAFGRKSYDDHPSAPVRKAVTRHFRTIRIDVHHDFIEQHKLRTHKDYIPILGEDLVRELCDAQRSIMTPTEDHLVAILGDFVVASRLPVRYCPNPFVARALSVCWEAQALDRSSEQQRTTAQLLVDIVGDLRNEVAVRYNELRKHAIYDLNIPSIFAAVLRESRTPDDIFVIARQFQNEAKPFLKWCEQLDQVKDPIDFLNGVEDAKAILASLGSAIGEQRDERLRITVIPGIAQLQIPIKASRKAERLYRQLEADRRNRSNIAFLLNIYSSVRKIRSMREELKRVFGYNDAVCHAISERFAAILGK